MPVPAIFITTACGDLDFLVPIVDRLGKELGAAFEHVRICCADDIALALERIRRSAATQVVIFSHGRDGELLGADPPPSGGHGPTWMDKPAHFAALAGKEVFCLACQSQTLAANAIAAGAKAFLGFSEVPFHRFDGDDPRPEPELEESCKQRIAEATQLSLLRWLVTGEALVEVAAYFRLCVRRSTADFARTEHPYRRGVIDLSLEMLKCSVVFAAPSTG